ncbi:hypothetical protein GEMRC1_009550 [Eukaryota sp. GEM-RC1]
MCEEEHDVDDEFGVVDKILVLELWRTISESLVDFRRNSIRSAGVRVLADAFKVNTTVASICCDSFMVVDMDYIGDVGAKALLQTLKDNTTVKINYVDQNLIGCALG